MFFRSFTSLKCTDRSCEKEFHFCPVPQIVGSSAKIHTKAIWPTEGSFHTNRFMPKDLCTKRGLLRLKDKTHLGKTLTTGGFIVTAERSFLIWPLGRQAGCNLDSLVLS